MGMEKYIKYMTGFLRLFLIDIDINPNNLRNSRKG
jgi:hypothetical protein